MSKRVFVVACGGVGNVLFQIAHGIAFATVHDVLQTNVFVCRTPCSFAFPAAMFSALNFVDSVPTNAVALRETNTRELYGTGLLDEPWPPGASDVVLHGYFQNSSILRGVLPTFISSLWFEEGAADALVDGLPTPVFVHVRRGDYTHLAWQYAQLTAEYFGRCVEHVLSTVPGDVSFIVVSDDLDWCTAQEWLHDLLCSSRSTMTLAPVTLSVAATLALMRLCDHGICANSTFSVWGALFATDRKRSAGLGEPIICVPRQWFNEASCERHLTSHNIGLAEWAAL